MALEGEPRASVPQPRGLVIRAGEKARAVGAESHTIDQAGMALEGEQLLARSWHPTAARSCQMSR